MPSCILPTETPKETIKYKICVGITLSCRLEDKLRKYYHGGVAHLLSEAVLSTMA